MRSVFFKYRCGLFLMSFLSFLFVSCQTKVEDEDEYIREAVKEINEKEILTQNLILYSYKDNERRMKNVPNMDSKNTLVFKFSDYDCDQCISEVFSFLESKIPNKKFSIEVWNQVNGRRSVYENSSWYNNIDNIKFRQIGFELGNQLASEDLRKPYFFTINAETKVVSNVFFPQLNKIEFTKKYLEIIFEKYRDNNDVR